VLIAVMTVAAGCTKPEPPPPAPSENPAPVISAKPPPARSAATLKSAPPPSRDSAEPPEQRDAGVASERWIVDEPTNVAPAGPASASSRGVVMLDREGRVVLAKLERQPAGPNPGPTGIAKIDAGKERFFSYGVGPAVASDWAFFIRKGKLRRRPIDGSGPEQVLATDARNGSRVAAVSVERAGKSVPVVAYVAQIGEHPVARLWIEGSELQTLSPDGSAASSVDLVTRGDELIAVAIEGRSGMSPVHARRIQFDAKAPHLDEDKVVWVGGSAQSLTEVTAAASSSDAWALVPIEKDTTHFGLARIHIGARPKTESPVSWREYPNGLDPAPTATTTLCDEPVVLYARPAEAVPRAPQELHLAAIERAGLSASQKVGFAGAFTNVSVAPIHGGALVTYVGDGRTWAVSVRCPRRAGPTGAQVK
jgi:hypothetical protein